MLPLPLGTENATGSPGGWASFPGLASAVLIDLRGKNVVLHPLLSWMRDLRWLKQFKDRSKDLSV